MNEAISFQNVVKKYGQHTVIPGLNLTIRQGEFFTLLGPSGCGKTTLLRMVAGFNSIEEGTISFHGKVINNVEPSKRNIGMVFQNYAVFPHMSVRDNVAFGLKTRKIPPQERSRRVDEILRVVKIEDLKDRMPDNMSGGQQQRVALARAIVINPAVLLMDEPLSNLDAKLRVEMRNAIKEIQNRINITTVYVTHDQEEAMAVSDRIAVMQEGRIAHCSTPQNIYMRPASLFVASFIGRTNILKGTLSGSSGAYTLHMDGGYALALNNLDAALLNQAMAGKQAVRVQVSIRPEDFLVSAQEGMQAKISDSVFLGNTTQYVVDTPQGESIEIIQESSVDHILPIGSTVTLAVKSGKINVYSEDGSLNYTSGVVNDCGEG